MASSRAVDDPAVGVQQRRRAEVAVAVPPVGGAGGRAAGAHDALVEAVELPPILDRLLPLALGLVGLRLEPGLHAGVLGIEVGEVGDEVLDHRHVRQRVDLHVALDLVHAVDAGQRVDAVDVHRAGAADALAAGAAEGQGRVDLVLDLDQRVEDHRAAGVHVDEVGVDLRVAAGVGIPAVDAEGADVGRALGPRPGLAGHHAAVVGQRQFDHAGLQIVPEGAAPSASSYDATFRACEPCA